MLSSCRTSLYLLDEKIVLSHFCLILTQENKSVCMFFNFAQTLH